MVPPEARRVLVALERAALSTLRRRITSLPLPLLVITIIACAPRAILHLRGGQPLVASTMAFSALMVVIGGVAAIVLTHAVVVHIRAHAYTLWVAAHHSSSSVLRTSFTSATALLVASQAIGLIAVLGMFIVLRLSFTTGTSTPAGLVSPSNAAASLASELCIYFGVGAVTTALWLQRLGSICIGTTRVGTSSAFQETTELDPKDPRNPAVLLDSLSSQLGEILPRVLDSFIEACLLGVVTVLLAAHPGSPSWANQSAAMACVPAVLKAFGLLSVQLGALSLRHTEQGDLTVAVRRGKAVSQAIFLASGLGTMVWLTATWSTPIAVALVAGALIPWLLGGEPLLRDRKTRQAFGASADNATTHGQHLETVGGALTRALPALATTTVALLSLFLWFRHAGAMGDAMAMLVALFGLASAAAMSPMHKAAWIAHNLLGTTTLSGRLGRLPSNEDSERRLARFAAGCERISVHSEASATDGGLFTCGLIAIVLQSWTPSAQPPLWIATWMALVLLSVIPTVASLGDLLSATARTVKTQVGELERQLRGPQRTQATISIAPDFVPSYRSSVELLARDGAHGGTMGLTLAVSMPLILIAVSSQSQNSPGSPLALLAGYVSVVTAAGLAITRIGHATRPSGSNPNRPRVSHSPGTSEARVLDSSVAVAGFIRHAIAVSLPLLAKAATLVALAAAAASLP